MNNKLLIGTITFLIFAVAAMFFVLRSDNFNKCDTGNCNININNRFGSNGIENFLEEFKNIGVGAVREWILWDEIEASEGVYNWAKIDSIVKKANDNKIDLIGYFRGVPNWAKISQSCVSDICAIEDINKFKDFAKTVAERYDGKHGHGEMKYIEVLNEVTTPKFFDLKNTNYSDWLIAGYQGIKEGNSDAKVLVGGFVNPLLVPDFVATMLKEYSDYYDIVSFHIYESDSDYSESIAFLKNKMNSHNVNKPMWITESATLLKYDEPDVNKKIAEGVIKRYSIAFGNGVEKVFWWPFAGLPSSLEYSGKGTSEKIAGLVWVYPKGQNMPMDEIHPRPAYNTFKIMTNKLSGFSSVAKIRDTQYKFVVDGKNVYVLWCDTGVCPLPSEISGRVKVTDYLGNDETMDAKQIILSEDPIFVE